MKTRHKLRRRGSIGVEVTMHRARTVLLLAIAAFGGCDGSTEGEEIEFRPGSQGDPEVWGVVGLETAELWVTREVEERGIARVVLYLHDGNRLHALDLGALDLGSSRGTTVELDPAMSALVDARVELTLEGVAEPIVEPLTIDVR